MSVPKTLQADCRVAMQSHRVVKIQGFELDASAQAAAVEKQKEAVRELVKRAPAKKLAGALLKKGYQVGRPQLSVGGSLLSTCITIICRPSDRPALWLPRADVMIEQQQAQCFRSPLCDSHF